LLDLDLVARVKIPMDLGTKINSDFVDKFYSPFTPWKPIPANFLALPDYYSIDLEQVRQEIQKITELHELRPFRVGSKNGRQRNRLSYRGLGLTSRPQASEPLYDSLNLYASQGKQLDIFETFAKVSEKIPGTERVIEILDETEFSEYTEACSPFFQNILKKFRSPFSKVRLLQLFPGGVIPPHVDFPYYEGIRVHAVIDSNPGVVWEVNGLQFSLPVDGRFYWFDTGKYHAVANRGSTPRLVLSVNLLVYKNRDGSQRFNENSSLEELINGCQV
jgi:hypothetical protein